MIGNGIGAVVDVDLVPDVRPIRRGRERPRSWVGRHCDNRLRGIGALEDIDIVDIPVTLERTRGERAAQRGLRSILLTKHLTRRRSPRAPLTGGFGLTQKRMSKSAIIVRLSAKE